VHEKQVLVGAYGADAVRYYFMAEIEFGKDGDFSEERFRDKVRCWEHLRRQLGSDEATSGQWETMPPRQGCIDDAYINAALHTLPPPNGRGNAHLIQRHHSSPRRSLPLQSHATLAIRQQVLADLDAQAATGAKQCGIGAQYGLMH
jgi:hypothetical protein